MSNLNKEEIKLCKDIIEEIKKVSKKDIKIMEVCGTHTRSIYKYGIDKVLPPNIKLISGPGCPVCVTREGFIEDAIKLCRREEVILVTFGDMIKVPCNIGTLEIEKAKGRDIRVITSPMQTLDIARNNKDKIVVFLGVGFETTMPAIAILLKEIKKNNISNFYILQEGKQMPKIIESLLQDEDIEINGFLVPGHVSTIIGTYDFEKLSKTYNVPMVVSGFECLDILISILILVKMINNKEYSLKNLYKRAVKDSGNYKAKNILDEVFIDSIGIWRGIGEIEKTGYELKEEYKKYDAKKYFKLENKKENIDNGCICKDILMGKKAPDECKLFKKVCNPDNPKGPCMVSQEGVCSILYLYK
ncbi:hydrogenase formation protein HypD [Clostridium sp.]|uniref:hydrogenase formation protein HypD n=1 Tax=Clostridium sp. TaxID=1506 RepID=UPI002A919657|nr:hydrogenase formation protein HypD [Clostridium sp.]MDY6012744.1 hydrogenase formation protein HypD [Clostridium sp.]